MKARRFTTIGGLILIVVLVGASETSASAQGEPGSPTDLALAAAVKLALQRHPALRAAGYQAAAAAAGVDQARASFLPRVDFSEGITRSDNPVYAFGALLNQGRFTQADFAVERLNHPDPLTNWRTNIAGSLPLFVGGRTVLGYQQAEIGREVAERGRARVEHEVIFGVTRAYYGVLLAQEAKATVDAAVRTAEANLASAESRYEAGMVVASDALAARVRLARLKEEAIAAANQLRLAHAGLNDAMGVALDQPYRIAGRLDLPPLRHERLEGLEALAHEKRPEYRQAALEEQRLEKEVLRAKGAFLPTMHLLGNYEINNHRFSADGQDSWSVGVVLNWNLFSGGADRARIVEAQASQRRASALRERLASAIALEVRDAFLALQTARERVTVAKDAVAHAEESLRIVQDRYDAGLTTIVELLDTETALTAARTNLTRTLYEATVGEARLELSLGTLDPARL
ncbi:MAG: TolC family protein [candidate division NC10 bacterium]|nr:TolC family protein [candidate division NC10 bacterium]